MNTKIAMRVCLPEHQECTICHCYTKEGYMLRDSNMFRLVCEECYHTVADQYPAAEKVVEIRKSALNAMMSGGRKTGFHMGYLMGRRESTPNGYKICVDRFLESIQEQGRGTVSFFNKNDTMLIHRESKEKGTSVVGLYRTSSKGTPDFNYLDQKTIEDVIFDIVYMVIAGNSEIQIAVRDKQNHSDEIGVVLSV